MIEDPFDMSLLWIAHSIAEKMSKEWKSDHSTLLVRLALYQFPYPVILYLFCFIELV